MKYFRKYSGAHRMAPPPMAHLAAARGLRADRDRANAERPILARGGHRQLNVLRHCPRRKPPFWAVRRPAQAMQTRYKTDLLCRTPRPRNRPGRARTDPKELVLQADADAEQAVQEGLHRRLGLDSAARALLRHRAGEESTLVSPYNPADSPPYNTRTGLGRIVPSSSPRPRATTPGPACGERV